MKVFVFCVQFSKFIASIEDGIIRNEIKDFSSSLFFGFVLPIRVRIDLSETSIARQENIDCF